MPSETLSGNQIQNIVETPVTGLKGRTPRQQILEEKPDNGGREKEPVFIIDRSRSNLEPVDPEGTMTKAEFLQQAIPLAAKLLAGTDSQAAHEVGTDKGGVRSFAFNEPGEFQGWDPEEHEFSDPRDLGDLHEGNVVEVLGNEDDWNGRTYPMPAVRASEKAFQGEFGSRPMRSRPTQMVVYWGDGQITTQEEEEAFENWVSQADEFLVIAIVLIGFGPGHDAAVKAFRRIAEKNAYVSVLALTGVASANEAALDVQLMAA
jgi:hypothetical protein